jgi:glutathione S-transferase
MTAKMLLHWSPRSPYVRKVMIVAHEVGIADRIETVRTVVAATDPNVELMKENPQSRLPTLRLADGTALYDSRVICEYLDTLHNGEKLYPASFPERLTALRRLALGDGMLDTMLTWRGEQLRPAANQSIKHMQAWKLKTNVSVDTLEEKEVEALAATSISAFPSWPGAPGTQSSRPGTRASRHAPRSAPTRPGTSHDPPSQRRRRAHHRRD